MRAKSFRAPYVYVVVVGGVAREPFSFRQPLLLYFPALGQQNQFIQWPLCQFVKKSGFGDEGKTLARWLRCV